MSVIEQICIGDKTIGEGSHFFVIGEVGLSHDGSLGMAHAYIDAIAATGADAVKFQTHIAEAEGAYEQFRVKVFPQDKTRYDYWRRTQFSEEQWKELRDHAEQKALVFLSSPFSIDAVNLLLRVGVKAWKVGSGEMSNLPMINELIKSGLPVLLSTGMNYYSEIDEVMDLLQKNNTPVILYQCASMYPAPPEKIGLNVIEEMKNRYNTPVGLSDHSGKVCVGLAAQAMGACSIEAHVTFSKNSFGPDVSSSLTIEELGDLVKSVRYMEIVYKNPVKKDVATDELKEMRKLFTKSVVTNSIIKAGAQFTADNLTTKKPGTGIKAVDYYNVLGKKAVRNLEANKIISWDDVADE